MANLVKLLTTLSFCFLIGCATSEPIPLTQKQIESICHKKKIEATKPTTIKNNILTRYFIYFKSNLIDNSFN